MSHQTAGGCWSLLVPSHRRRATRGPRRCSSSCTPIYRVARDTSITAISRSSISKPSASAATSRNPDRSRRNWKKKPEARTAVYRNRRRIRGARGLRLLRLRGERLERPFARTRSGRLVRPTRGRQQVPASDGRRGHRVRVEGRIAPPIVARSRASIVVGSSGTREPPGYIADLTEDFHVGWREGGRRQAGCRDDRALALIAQA